MKRLVLLLYVVVKILMIYAALITRPLTVNLHLTLSVVKTATQIAMDTAMMILFLAVPQGK